MLAKFPPPPYRNKKARELLESLIKSQSSALRSWPEYVVELVGHADTYEKSIERLDVLQKEEFAYTTDSDNSGKQKASQIMEKIKNQTLEQIMEVPRIGSNDSSASSGLSSSPEVSNSSSENIPAMLVRRKNIKGLSTVKNNVLNYESHNQNYASSKSAPKKIFQKNQSQNPVKNNVVSGGACISEALPVPPARKIEFSRLQKTSTFNKNLSTAADTLQQASKDYTKDTLLIMHTLKGLSIDLQENTNAINNLCAAVEANSTSSHVGAKKTALVFQSDFDLPFQTLEQFKDFDKQLNDSKYRQHCADSLLFYIDHDNQVSRSVTNIMKRFVGREVTLKFTAVKQMGQKEVFKNTKFCNVMCAVITQNHTDKQGNPVAEKYFLQCLGHSIANAKDWDGCRIQRVKNKPHTELNTNIGALQQ